MRKHFLILLGFCGLFSASAQHLELLSGANTEAFLYNPAAAGEKGYLAFTAGRRYQWLGFDGAPRNSYVSLHTPLLSKKVNLGFLYIHDEIGIFTRHRLQGAYAFRMKMGKWNAALGLNAGLSAGRSAWSGVALNQNPDAAFPLTDSRFLFPEAGAGVQLHHPVFHFNFSTQNLLPQEQLSRASYPSFTASGEWFIQRPQITWSLFGLVRQLHHSPVQSELQWKGTFNQAFTIGAGYRMGDALLLMAGFRINRQIYLYYSYENGISPLADHHTGSHEILFRYEFGYPVSSEDPRTAQ